MTLDPKEQEALGSALDAAQREYGVMDWRHTTSFTHGYIAGMAIGAERQRAEDAAICREMAKDRQSAKNAPWSGELIYKTEQAQIAIENCARSIEQQRIPPTIEANTAAQPGEEE